MTTTGSLELRTIPLDKLPWSLMHEADPERAHIEEYIQDASRLGAYAGDSVVGIAIVGLTEPGIAELHAIAAERAYRRQGVGRWLLINAREEAIRLGAQTLRVATGNSSLDQLRFYQRSGFRMMRIDRGYFDHAFAEPLVEDGIRCRDRVWLDMPLPKAKS